MTEADQLIIERLCTRLGMNLQQTAEWLIKRRLARVARQANGQGRALYMLPRQCGAAEALETSCT
ncbi:MAG: hypothetical protein FWG56_12080 [Desulfovibrionaceae bacterium]|nr:hypothetical protein [Desulfovibrionaceae bacterium]